MFTVLFLSGRGDARPDSGGVQDVLPAAGRGGPRRHRRPRRKVPRPRRKLVQQPTRVSTED